MFCVEAKVLIIASKGNGRIDRGFMGPTDCQQPGVKGAVKGVIWIFLCKALSDASSKRLKSSHHKNADSVWFNSSRIRIQH